MKLNARGNRITTGATWKHCSFTKNINFSEQVGVVRCRKDVPWPQSTLIQIDQHRPPHRELLLFTAVKIKILICCIGATLQNMRDYEQRH